MGLFEIVLGIVSSVFSLMGIYSLGAIAGKAFSTTKFKTHFYISLGLGVYQLLFIFLSLSNHAFFTQIACIFVLLFAISYKRMEIIQLFRSIGTVPKLDIIFLFIIFFPFICRLFSPPTSPDGLSFYLPAVEWIYNYGLKFNPYLTNYTTMPQGVEYFYTLSYCLGGFSAVRLTDAFFTLLLIHLIYNFSKKMLSVTFARITTLVCLFIPKTFFVLFGTGKIDTISTYIIMTGFALLIVNWKSKTLVHSIVLFSISLGIKYTNWILLFLPLLFLISFQIYQKRTLKSILLLLVPILFAGPVLIKNKIHVNNPLAPLIETKTQTRFVSSHGKLPKDQVVKLRSKTPQQKIIKRKHVKKILYLVSLLLILGLCRILFVNSTKFRISKLWLWILFLSISFLPWLYFLGLSSQPTRFVWVPILILAILTSLYLESVLKYKSWYGVFSKSILIILLLTLISERYYNHSFRISRFVESRNMSLKMVSLSKTIGFTFRTKV